MRCAVRADPLPAPKTLFGGRTKGRPKVVTLHLCVRYQAMVAGGTNGLDHEISEQSLTDCLFFQYLPFDAAKPSPSAIVTRVAKPCM